MFDVINSSIMNNFATFRARRKILKDDKMFFKDQGQNQLW